MKKLVILLIIIFSNNSIAQFKTDYKEINLKYSDLNFEDTFVISKIINEKESALFSFLKKDSLLVSVHFEKADGYTIEEYNNNINNFLSNFKYSKYRSWENWDLYYDENNNIIVIKVFNSSLKVKIKEIIITSEQKTIERMLQLFDNKH